jgi:hypothetical protein
LYKVATSLSAQRPEPLPLIRLCPLIRTCRLCAESADVRIAAQQLLMNTPELLARVMEIILRRLKHLDGSGRGNPAASDRLNHR